MKVEFDRGDSMILSKVRYKYLYAWDMIQHSSFAWIRDMQAQAEAEDAPEDAVYKAADGTWRRFKDIESANDRARIQAIVNRMQKHAE